MWCVVTQSKQNKAVENRVQHFWWNWILYCKLSLQSIFTDLVRHFLQLTNLELSFIFIGMNELMDLASKAECKRIEGECARGTVVMDPWLNKTLTFQRRLGQNISLDRQQIFGTHNSFNDKADGWVFWPYMHAVCSTVLLAQYRYMFHTEEEGDIPRAPCTPLPFQEIWLI